MGPNRQLGQGPEPCGITQLSEMGWTPALWPFRPHNTLTSEPHPIVEVQEPGFPEGDHALKVTCAKRPSRAFAHSSH